MTQKKVFKIVILAAAGLLIVNLSVLGYFLFFSAEVDNFNLNDQNKVIFLDVGQGDAILIQTQIGQNILIDGGPDRQIIYKLDQYISAIDRRIDLMILTHPDPDHLNGLVEVLKRYKVNRVISTGVDDPDSAYIEWKKIIQEKQILSEFIEGIQTSKVDDDISLEFIWPRERVANQSFKDDNQVSIVSELIVNQRKFLLMADADKAVEQNLIKIGEDLKADVLKVGHHGSKNSSSLEFLNEAKPQYAVISVGKNNFGHPSFRALTNLGKIDAQVLRTDEKGDIIFIINDQQLNLKFKK